jgi:hypothetical protein
LFIHSKVNKKQKRKTENFDKIASFYVLTQKIKINGFVLLRDHLSEDYAKIVLSMIFTFWLKVINTVKVILFGDEEKLWCRVP